MSEGLNHSLNTQLSRDFLPEMVKKCKICLGSQLKAKYKFSFDCHFLRACVQNIPIEGNVLLERVKT